MRGPSRSIGRDGPGDRDKARELLTEAIAMYRQIGMPKHVEMAEAMLGEVKPSSRHLHFALSCVR